jgi:hypothetical protein
MGQFLDILVVDIDIGRLRLDGMRRDEDTFQDLVRVRLEKIAVLEGTGFMLAGIANEKAFRDPVIQHLFPFYTGRKTGSPAPAKPGPLELCDHFFP